MRAEYLLFDLLVAAGPVGLSAWSKLGYRADAKRSLRAIVAVALPFIVWDACVAGRHWWFDERYTLGLAPFGLPIEELLFFLVVPFACTFLWDMVFRGRALPPGGTKLRYVHAAFLGVGALGPIAWVQGLEYTALTAMALGGFALLDHGLGSRLLERPRFVGFLAAVCGLNLLCNGYLTWRPIVHYDPRYQLDLRIGTIPIEDFGYGIALVGSVVSLHTFLAGRARGRSWVASLIERRLGGYRQLLQTPDPSSPIMLEETRRVGVIGGGLAGLSAASLLAQRGFDVTLFERNAYLGGKVAGWRETLPDGFEAEIEHGFHAFFRHYYNLSQWLDDVGPGRSMRTLDDYAILTADGRRISFDDSQTTPGLNLLHLARQGLYDLKEVALGPAGRELQAFMQYDRDKTFAAYDDTSFAEFAERAHLPKDLRLVFNTFARAFFADDDRLSLAELIKSFHFYYLSHDCGLTYEFLDGTYRERFIEPIAEHLRALGVEIHTGVGIDGLERIDGRLHVEGRAFDEVVLATDIKAAREIVGRSEVVQREDPELAGQMSRTRPGQRYAVWRLWVDRPSVTDLPVFVATERLRVLDAVAFNDRIDETSRRWAEEHAGGVIELHSYAVPDDLDAATLTETLLRELEHHFPGYAGVGIVHQHLQLRDDFTALHVGMWADRPACATKVAGLHLAGDWVKLPTPAMLMEAAHVAGRLASNAILEASGLRAYPVYTVPLEGLLAGIPKPPGKRAA